MYSSYQYNLNKYLHLIFYSKGIITFQIQFYIIFLALLIYNIVSYQMIYIIIVIKNINT